MKLAILHPVSGASYSETHNSVDCRLHIQRSKPKLNASTVETIIYPRIAPNPKRSTRHPSPNSKQNPSIHATFSTNTHIPLDMWKNINN